MHAATLVELETLGWDPRTVGEQDHRLLKAPSLKLRSARSGGNGDAIFCIDLRIRRPNANEYLSTTELHSVEHFLLEGFQRLLPTSFVSVGVMGCQTGFYLTFLNDARAKVIGGALAQILTGMRAATAVPYARIDQCGNYRNHSLERARRVAEEVLRCEAAWLQAL